MDGVSDGKLLVASVFMAVFRGRAKHDRRRALCLPAELYHLRIAFVTVVDDAHLAFASMI